MGEDEVVSWETVCLGWCDGVCGKIPVGLGVWVTSGLSQ